MKLQLRIKAALIIQGNDKLKVDQKCRNICHRPLIFTVISTLEVLNVFTREHHFLFHHNYHHITICKIPDNTFQIQLIQLLIDY